MNKKVLTLGILTATAAITGCQTLSQSGSSDDPLRFDNQSYESQTLTVNGQSMTVRAYEDIVYIANPVDTQYQTMNIYVPEAYYNGDSINGYSAATAPIFFPNQVGGYMPATAGTAQTPTEGRGAGEATTIAKALAQGYVVASAGARGRTTQDDAGNYTGKAPAAIVDLKAAIRYLHHNDARMAGNAHKIFSNGTSAGGALSALLGASGDSADYAPYLQALGAADASDSIYAVSAYCPITNLEHADAAYEWQFNGINDYEKMNITMLDYNVKRELVPGTLDAQQVSVSNDLKKQFPAYVNSLNLKDKNGKPLTLDAQGNGSFKQAVMRHVGESFAAAVTAGEDLSAYSDWLLVDQTANGSTTVTLTDYQGYLSDYMGRQKTPPAFDALDLSSGENQLFGTKTLDTRHFTQYGMDNSSADNASMAESKTIHMMNAMHYLHESAAGDTVDTAQHWRIRQGAKDADTSLAIPVILATTLENEGKTVDFSIPWNQGHAGDYDLDELFAWIDSVAKSE